MRNLLIIAAMLLVTANTFAAASSREQPDRNKPPALAETGQGQTETKTTEKDLDTEELIDQLINEALGQSTDPMQQIIDYMAQSAELIGEKYDLGQKTQLTQKRIVEELTKLIKQLARQSSSCSSCNKKSQGQCQGRKPGKKPAQGNQGGRGSTQPMQDERATHGQVQTGKLNDPLKETRREWGNLKAKDREQVVQGSKETFNEKFRNMIEDYYRALAEQNE